MTGTLRVVSVSGGKDSTALYLLAVEKWGRDGFIAVFADTAHEHPVTINYLRNLPEMAKGPPITWVKSDFKEILKKKGKEPSGDAFLDMMLWKGRAPSARAQFCTEHLKLRPIREWLNSVSEDREVLMYVGLRAGESPKRAKKPHSEWSDFYDCQIHYPLLRWTEDQIFSYLKDKGVPPNPLYGFGFGRVGCFPCIHATKSELARLPDWAWAKIQEWEIKLGRSWFSPGKIPGGHVPTVQEVRKWSKTLHGGREIDPSAPDAKDVPTCMSTWGVCE